MRPTIYAFAGGDTAFQRLAAAHHARCLADPVLEHPFSHPGHPEHVQRLGAYWAEVLGGPRLFSETCGDESGVLDLHAGTGAGDDYGERFLACFTAALDDAELPDDPVFRAALIGYMRWAVDRVIGVSPLGAQVERGLTVPRWGWDGLEAQP